MKSHQQTRRTRSQKSRRTRKSLRLERLERRTLLAADLGGMHNHVDPEDVNDDGTISPVDVLMVVNDLNTEEPGRRGERGFVDVSGDEDVSPVDALLVINRLNQPDRNRPPRPDPPNGDPGQIAAEPRTFDGTGNNLDNPAWGSTDIQLLRLTSAEYEDGASEPAGADRASAREISNLVAAQTESTLNERGLSDLVWQWGQFLDHDIDLTGELEPTEEFPIAVPTGDPFFDPVGTGTQTISLHRSDYDKDTGDSSENPRQQTNAITAFIDGSNVYGSDEARAAALRTFDGGRLKTSEGDLLPFNEEGLDNAGGPSSSLFLAGDVRANEQAGLTAMHTLWVREHNRLADEIAERNPELTDEEIYQHARSIVIAQMQAITFNEFLPALLGRDAIPKYEGYDPAVNAGISNAFSTAAYRFGHSMLSSELLRLDNDGEVIAAGNLALRDAFFSPDELTENGIDSLLKGLARQQAQEIDNQLVDDVRNFLFGPPGSGGFDLAALNIQRGRDHGLADYNQVRADFGLEPVSDFDEITSDPELQAALEQAYGDVNSIDAWVGGLAEDHVRGGSVGELVQTVLVDQFTRLRDGDRYWYQNQMSGRELRQIESTTLADVIRRNTDVTNLQRNVFFVPDAETGGHHRRHDLERDPNPADAPPPPAEQPVGTATAPEATGEAEAPQTVNAGEPEGIKSRESRSGDRRGETQQIDEMFAQAADEFFGDMGDAV